MRISILVSMTVATLALASGQAFAEEATPGSQVFYNLGASTDYRFRGISRTARTASVSASANYSNTPAGISLGLAANKVTFIQDTPGAASTPVQWTLNMDKFGSLGGDFSYDVGASAYVYLNARMATNPNTGEVHGRLSYGATYVSYSRSLTNLFGSANSRGSGYLLLGSSAVVLNDYTLEGHVGRQLVMNHANEKFVDWGVGISRNFGVATASLSVVGTIVTDRSAYTNASGTFLGPTSLILSVSKSF